MGGCLRQVDWSEGQKRGSAANYTTTVGGQEETPEERITDDRFSLYCINLQPGLGERQKPKPQ